MKSKKTKEMKPFEPPARLLSLRNPDDLHWEMQAVQLAIARRAYELFETHGREHGRDWEDWFRAESELLRPVSVSMSESEDHISVRANVLGFGEKELAISVEPDQITILGKRETPTKELQAEIDYTEPDQILKIIDLPKEVRPESSVVELQAGVLSFEVMKAARQAVEIAPAAA